MDWKGREQSQNVEDRRGSSGGGGGGRTPGILGIIVVLIGAYYGVDLSGLVGTPSMGTGSTQTSQLKPQEEADLNELARVVLADTEKAWGSYFKQIGRTYTPTTLVLYNGGTSTACGMGQSAMGPFYCPGDKKVYLDLDFYRDMQTKLNSASDAAFAYVIAHEVGHHVQNLLGILLRGQLGALRRQQSSLQTRRHPQSHAGCRIRRRRPPAERRAGLRRSRQLYTRLVRTAHGMAQTRFGQRRHQSMQHIRQLIETAVNGYLI